MTTLSKLVGTNWVGNSELWLDPLGDKAVCSECSISVDKSVVHYTWSYEGRANQGRITLHASDAEFVDTWHQPEPMTCKYLPDAWGLFQVQGEYGPGSDWRWRIALSVRTPTSELLLQMTNVAPWGEEARAVRMTCTAASSD